MQLLHRLQCVMQSATEGTDTPVVSFRQYTDPVGAGLVESLDAPGEQISQVLQMHLDTASVMNLMLAANPDVKKVGLLYDVRHRIPLQNAIEDAIAFL